MAREVDETSIVAATGALSIPDDGRPATIEVPGSLRVWKKHDDPEGPNHRVGGPAEIYADGSWKWVSEGKLHRDMDLPAVYSAGPGGYVEYWVHGERHRNGDAPTLIAEDGRRAWFSRGMRHRVGGPAAIFPGGRKEWWQHGQLHRDDGPATVMPMGKNSRDRPLFEQKWYRHGKLHRVGGPAILHPDGTQEWLQDGRHHRPDGPAVVGPEGREWFVDGQLHRTDGPAIDKSSGERGWYLEGEKLSEEEWQRRTRPRGRRAAGSTASSVSEAMNRR